MRLGEFDPAEMNPYTKLDLTEVESAEHQSLAVEAAGKTFVLLKNSGQLLPLKTSYSTVSVGVLVFGCGGFYWGFWFVCVWVFCVFWLFFVEGWGYDRLFYFDCFYFCCCLGFCCFLTLLTIPFLI